MILCSILSVALQVFYRMLFYFGSLSPKSHTSGVIICDLPFLMAFHHRLE